MNLEQMKKIVNGAPDGATHYLIYDGCLYYFQKRGAQMHQWIKTRLTQLHFLVRHFISSNRSRAVLLPCILTINLIKFTIGNIRRPICKR